MYYLSEHYNTPPAFMLSLSPKDNVNKGKFKLPDEVRSY